MSVKELKIGVGLTYLRVNDALTTDGHVVLTTQQVGGTDSMVAMLDRNAQHLLMLYLQERLAK